MRWKNCLTIFTIAFSSVAAPLAGCSGDDSTETGSGGSGGQGGSTGTAGSATSGGGKAGAKATGGASGAGTGGTGGSATGGGGNGGGSSGSAGSGGGTAGSTGGGGTAGTAGSGGTGVDGGKDAGADAAQTDARADTSPDTSVPSDSAPDVSADAGPDVASDANAMPDVRNADAGENLECKSCELEQCPDYLARCDNPNFNAAQHQNCVDLLFCVRQSSCHRSTVVDCYCGTADAVECRQAGQANGACKALIEQGLNSTDPNVILPNFQDETLPAGAAMSIAFCDTEACDEDVPSADPGAPDGGTYTACLPYYR